VCSGVNYACAFEVRSGYSVSGSMVKLPLRGEVYAGFLGLQCVLLVVALASVLLLKNAKDDDVVSVAVTAEYLEDLPGCLAIINGDPQAAKDSFGALMRARRRPKGLSTEFYRNITRDCAAYVETRGFVAAPRSAEERDFAIAYSMVIHGQIEMFERLLRALYQPQNVYCVHVDAKSPRDFLDAVRSIVACFPNVFMASRMEVVIYATWSRVQADLNCMADLLRSPVPWRYMLNTCGTDFPIKTNAEMVKALLLLKARNSMESEPTREHKTRRWRYHHEVTADSIVQTEKEKRPPPIAYMVATRAFVRHVIEDPEIQAFVKWEKDTYCPDEHMWATMQRMPSVPGSNPADRKYDESDMTAVARLVKWHGLDGERSKGAPYAPYAPCTGVYRRSVCVYGAGDLNWLLRQKHLLANKFDHEVDDVSIRCLEAYLHFKARGTQ